MNPDKVVVHVVDRQRRQMILDLLAKGIRQSGETAVVHPDSEVLALDIAGADFLRVRASLDCLRFTADACRGAVAALAIGVDLPVHLDEHGVVDVVAECCINRLQVRLVAVAGQLHAIGKAWRKVFHKGACRARITLADHEAGNQLCIGVDGYPRPDVATVALFEFLGRHLLLLTAHEAPKLIDLNQFAGKVHQRLVHVLGTGRAKLYQKLRNRIFGNAGHAYCRTDRASLNQGANHLNLLSFI